MPSSRSMLFVLAVASLLGCRGVPSSEEVREEVEPASDDASPDARLIRDGIEQIADAIEQLDGDREGQDVGQMITNLESRVQTIEDEGLQRKMRQKPAPASDVVNGALEFRNHLVDSFDLRVVAAGFSKSGSQGDISLIGGVLRLGTYPASQQELQTLLRDYRVICEQIQAWSKWSDAEEKPDLPISSFRYGGTDHFTIHNRHLAIPRME